MKSYMFPARRKSVRAFTLVELVVVVGVAFVLGLLLVQAVAGTRPDGLNFQCRNNLRLLQVGWQAYADDNAGTIIPTAGTANPTAPQWCFGRMDIVAESTNVAPIQRGLLWPHVRLLSAYKCPADPKKGAGGRSTLRSVSMNAWMNPASTPSSQGLSSPGRVFRKQSDIAAAMAPSRCWVLMEENHNSINDGTFFVSANSNGINGNIWIDVPGAHHNSSGTLSFADGHIASKRWRDQRLLSATVVFTPADSSQNPPYADLRWLQERSTVAP